MQYNIILNSQELEIISRILQEAPYKIVKPILDNIAWQVSIQNNKNKEWTVEKE